MSRKFSRTKGMIMKNTAARGAPSIIQGLRRPNRVQVRSLRSPTQGCKNMFRMLSQVRMKPMRPAASPRSSSMGGMRELKMGQMMEMPKNPNPTTKV